MRTPEGAIVTATADRVRIRPAAPQEPQETFPQFASMPAAPGVLGKAVQVMTYFAGRKKS